MINYVNSKIKHKSKTILGVIRNLLLDFILYFVTAYMRKCLVHVTLAQGTTQHTLYITWGSKYKILYDKQFTTVTKHKLCSELLEWKMIESTYKVNTHCNLLYTRNMELFELDVNKICGLLRNSWRTTKWDRSLGIEGRRVVATTSIKSLKNWVIYIGDNVY